MKKLMVWALSNYSFQEVPKVLIDTFKRLKEFKIL